MQSATPISPTVSFGRTKPISTRLSTNFPPTEMPTFACKKVVTEIRRLDPHSPIVVALDGPSGTGKSILATSIEDELDAVLIPIDDFFSTDIPDYKWDEYSIEERLDSVFAWKRLRDTVLQPLLAGRSVRWYPFDFESGLRPNGTYGMKNDPEKREPAEVILLEGAYSTSPKLVDLITLSVLVEAPVEERQARLGAREEAGFLETWHRRWDPVERYYFTHIRPRETFDLIVDLI